MSFARQSLGSLAALVFGVAVSVLLPRVLGPEARGEYQLAVKLAAGPTRSLGQTKRLYRRSLVSDMVTSFAEEAAATALLSQTHDRIEGVQSFIERRPAKFQGR